LRADWRALRALRALRARAQMRIRIGANPLRYYADSQRALRARCARCARAFTLQISQFS
jgi:hypothetical protein